MLPLQRSRGTRHIAVLLAAGLAVGTAGGLSTAHAQAAATGKAASPTAQGPTLTIGAQNNTPDGLQLSDVTILYPGTSAVTLAVKTITVKAASGNGPSGLLADEIRLSGASVTSKTSPAVVISLDDAVLTGVSAPVPSAASFNVSSKPGDLPPLAEWLLNLKAASIQAPAIRVHAGRGSDSTDIVYRDVTLTDVDAGKIASIAEAGAEQVIAADKLGAGKAGAAPAKLTMGRLLVKDVDLNAYAAWLDDGLAASAPRTKRTLYSSATLDGVSFTGDGATVAIGSLAVNGVRLGPPAQKPSELMAVLAGAGQTQNPTPEQKAQLAGFMRSVFGAFEMGSFEMKGMKVEPPGQPPVSIGSMSMTNFTGGSLGEVRLDDLDATGGDGTVVKLGSFSVRGFSIEDLDPALERISSGSNPETWTPDQYPKLRVAGVSVSGVEATMPGKGRFTLGALSIDLPNWIGFTASAMKLHLQGLSVPASAIEDERSKQQLAELGLQTVSIAGDSDIAWHEDGTLSFGPTSLDVEGVGRAEIDGLLGGIPRSVFEHPETAQQAAASLDVRRMSLKLQDGGSFSKLMDQTARQQNTTRPAMAQQVSQMVEGGMIMMLGMQEAGHQLGTALRDFITDPKSLAVSLTASEPLPALALSSIAEGNQAVLELIRKSVTIEATANE